MVVRHHVVLVLYKSSKCSKPPSHLSNPSSVIFRTLNSKEVKKAKKKKNIGRETRRKYLYEGEFKHKSTSCCLKDTLRKPSN